MDTVYATFLDSMCSFFFSEAWRITGQCIWKFFFFINGINEFSDHRMFTGTNQIEILALDLVHHGIHFVKTHNSGYHIAADHKWRYTVCESAVDHKISRIGNHCGMKSCNVTHQIVKTVARYFSCCI